MNTLLWSKNFTDSKVTDLEAREESLTVQIGDSTITFKTHHDQDCCEKVYGDFSIAQYHKEHIVNKDLKKIEIKAVEDMGFLICFYFDWETAEKIFIPCYNSQNGYYSDELSLIIIDGEIQTEIDISNFVEDDIN